MAMRKLKLMSVMVLLAGGMLAQDAPPVPAAGMGRLYWSSVAFSAAGNGFDAATSWGRPELNPMMRSRDGRFGYRAAGLKVGYLAGTIIMQTRYLKRHKRAITIANFAAGGLWFAVGVSNLARR